jgi:hypothetical protein
MMKLMQTGLPSAEKCVDNASPEQMPNKIVPAREMEGLEKNMLYLCTYIYCEHLL